VSVLERAARQEAAAAATKEEQGAPTVDSLQSKALTRKASAPNRVALTVPSNNTLAAATSQRPLHSHAHGAASAPHLAAAEFLAQLQRQGWQ